MRGPSLPVFVFGLVALVVRTVERRAVARAVVEEATQHVTRRARQPDPSVALADARADHLAHEIVDQVDVPIDHLVAAYTVEGLATAQVDLLLIVGAEQLEPRPGAIEHHDLAALAWCLEEVHILAEFEAELRARLLERLPQQLDGHAESRAGVDVLALRGRRHLGQVTTFEQRRLAGAATRQHRPEARWIVCCLLLPRVIRLEDRCSDALCPRIARRRRLSDALVRLRPSVRTSGGLRGGRAARHLE